MSSYFYLWRSSEAAKDLILPWIVAAVIGQILGSYIMRHFRMNWGKAEYTVYIILCVVVDLVIGIVVGLGVKQ